MSEREQILDLQQHLLQQKQQHEELVSNLNTLSGLLQSENLLSDTELQYYMNQLDGLKTSSGILQKKYRELTGRESQSIRDMNAYLGQRLQEIDEMTKALLEHFEQFYCHEDQDQEVLKDFIRKTGDQIRQSGFSCDAGQNVLFIENLYSIEEDSKLVSIRTSPIRDRNIKFLLYEDLLKNDLGPLNDSQLQLLKEAVLDISSANPKNPPKSEDLKPTDPIQEDLSPVQSMSLNRSPEETEQLNPDADKKPEDSEDIREAEENHAGRENLSGDESLLSNQKDDQAPILFNSPDPSVKSEDFTEAREVGEHRDRQENLSSDTSPVSDPETSEASAEVCLNEGRKSETIDDIREAAENQEQESIVLSEPEDIIEVQETEEIPEEKDVHCIDLPEPVIQLLQNEKLPVKSAAKANKPVTTNRLQKDFSNAKGQSNVSALAAVLDNGYFSPELACSEILDPKDEFYEFSQNMPKLFQMGYLESVKYQKLPVFYRLSPVFRQACHNEELLTCLDLLEGGDDAPFTKRCETFAGELEKDDDSLARFLSKACLQYMTDVLHIRDDCLPLGGLNSKNSQDFASHLFLPELNTIVISLYPYDDQSIQYCRKWLKDIQNHPEVFDIVVVGHDDTYAKAAAAWAAETLECSCMVFGWASMENRLLHAMDGAVYNYRDLERVLLEENGELLAWNSLDIPVPEKALTHNAGIITCKHSPYADDEFDLGQLETDFEVNLPNRTAIVYSLTLCRLRKTIVGTEKFDIIDPKERKRFQTHCTENIRHLMDMGYVSLLQIKGHKDIYTLSNLGHQVFDTLSGRAFLEKVCSSFRENPQLYEEARPVPHGIQAIDDLLISQKLYGLASILQDQLPSSASVRIQNYSLEEEADEENEFDPRSFGIKIAAEGFPQIGQLFCSVFGDSPLDFNFCQAILEKAAADPDIHNILVCGINSPQAKALAGWVYETCRSSGREIPVWWTTVFEGTFHAVPKERSLSLDQYVKKLGIASSRGDGRMSLLSLDPAASLSESNLKNRAMPKFLRPDEPIVLDLRNGRALERLNRNIELQAAEQKPELLAKPESKPEPEKPAAETAPKKEKDIQSAQKPKDKPMQPELPFEEVQEKASAPQPEAEKTEPAIRQTVKLPEPEELEQLEKLIHAGKMPYAMAAANDLKYRYPNWSTNAGRLAYALDDPQSVLDYSAGSILTVFSSMDTSRDEEAFVSAAIRSLFYDHASYDYASGSLKDASYTCCSSQEIRNIVHELYSFQKDNKHGLDAYADYRHLEHQEISRKRTLARRDLEEKIRTMIDSPVSETSKNRRYLEAVRYLFSGSEGLFTLPCRQALEEDPKEVGQAREFMQEYLIRDGSEIMPENLDDDKINALISLAWKEAGKTMSNPQMSSQLMGHLKNNLINKIRRMGSSLAEYLYTAGMGQDIKNERAMKQYISARTKILQNLEDFRRKYPDEYPILHWTLKDLEQRLTGTVSSPASRSFYISFLEHPALFLNEEWLPDLEPVGNIASLQPFARLMQSAHEEPYPFEKQLEDTLMGNANDFGRIRSLIRWKEMTGNPVPENIQKQLSDSIPYARKQAQQQLDKFTGDLAVYQSEGRFDSSNAGLRDEMKQLAKAWYEKSEESENFSWYARILNEFREEIAALSVTRRENLLQSLVMLEENKTDLENIDTIDDLLKEARKRINNLNFTAAEDLINRISSRDLSHYELQNADYLQEFLDQFEDLYPDASSNAPLSSLKLHHSTGRDNRGARAILENFPKNSSPTAASVQELIKALGLGSYEVVQTSREKERAYYEANPGTDIKTEQDSWSYPIPAFGSQAHREGLQILVYSASTSAEHLYEVIRERNRTRSQIVLLNYTLSLPERNQLAKLFKTEGNSHPVIVIDRIAAIWLARHYKDVSAGRMCLAITLPYAYCQPYMKQAARSIPPELFMGRYSELEDITSRSGANLVYGGRQLGKTALLQMARSRVNQYNDGSKAILVDLKNLDAAGSCLRISSALYEEKFLKEDLETADWNVLAKAIRRRLNDTAHPVGYFLLMLDEADTFLEDCAKCRYKPIDALKDLQAMPNGQFKFVLAGLHNVLRSHQKSVMEYNSPLAHLNSLAVGPLKVGEAEELLLQPLSYLGFRFPEDKKGEMVSNILGTTNYYPGLIQLYGAKMIEAMKNNYGGYSAAKTPPYTVSDAHFRSILTDGNLLNEITNKFMITLQMDEDDCYMILAKLIAWLILDNPAQSGVSADEILSLAKTMEIGKIARLSEEETEALLVEMMELNVLQKSGGLYRFSRNNFLSMLGTRESLEADLYEYMEDAAA